MRKYREQLRRKGKERKRTRVDKEGAEAREHIRRNKNSKEEMTVAKETALEKTYTRN